MLAHWDPFSEISRLQQNLWGRSQPEMAFRPAVDIYEDAEGIHVKVEVPGIKPEDTQGELGKGPQINVIDAGMIPHLGLRNLVYEVAEDEKLKMHLEAVIDALPQLLGFAGESRSLERAVDDRHHRVELQGLGEIALGAELDRLNRRVDRSKRGHHDERRVLRHRTALLDE